MGKLDGAVAVVTGGSSGIGAATARLFASEGAAVAILVQEIDAEAHDLIATVEAAGGRAIAAAADVGDEQAVAAAFDQVKAAFGPATILVNSAGVDASGIPVAEMELAHFEAVLRTNLIGPFLCARAFIRGLPTDAAAGSSTLARCTRICRDRVLPTTARPREVCAI